MSKLKIINDTGWKPIESIVGDETGVGGRVQPVTGLETQPCSMCRSWEKNDKKLKQHIASKKDIEVLPDGTFRHLVDQDVPDRETKTYNIRDFGFCRFHGIPSQILHSCENWVPTKSIADFQRKFGK